MNNPLPPTKDEHEKFHALVWLAMLVGLLLLFMFILPHC